MKTYWLDLVPHSATRVSELIYIPHGRTYDTNYELTDDSKSRAQRQPVDKIHKDTRQCESCGAPL
ncbi:hypothetical protein M2277_002030 [Paenibacillus sp. LBL]|nr:hypothetical protein [Paenibacillus sp. LBL]